MKPDARHLAAGFVFLAAMALVVSDRVPFWKGMTALLAFAGLAAALMIRRDGERVFRPTWADTGLGLLLALGSWGLVEALTPWLDVAAPPVLGGLRLVAGYAAGEPLAWQLGGVLVIATAEEVIWRRYLPGVIAGWRPFGPAAAQLASAGLYAGMHLFSGVVWLAVPALGFGAAWGLLTAWRGGPWAAIVWHLVFDVLVFLELPWRSAGI